MTIPSDFSAIARVATLMQFAHGDRPIGIPWDLFEQYVHELQASQRIVIVQESPNGLCAAAPGSDGVFTKDGPRFVYPVIA